MMDDKENLKTVPQLDENDNELVADELVDDELVDNELIDDEFNQISNDAIYDSKDRVQNLIIQPFKEGFVQNSFQNSFQNNFIQNNFNQNNFIKNVNNLCDDLLILIFKHFNVEELFVIEQVCKRWYELVALNRRSCLCLSLLGAQQNEDRTHWCNNKLHSCNSRKKYSFGNFKKLTFKILPKYESVQTLHLNLNNLKSNQQKIILNHIAFKFNNLVHLQVQFNADSTTVYRQLIKLNFLSTNRLQHLILSNTINYEAGDLNNLGIELACNQRLKKVKLSNQYSHYKIPCKFPFLKTFQSDFISLQLPSITKDELTNELINNELKNELNNSLNESYRTLKFLTRLRMTKCTIEEHEFISLFKLFPNLEHLTLKQLDSKQCSALTSRFANSIQTLRINEIEPQDLGNILNYLCSMRKLRHIKLICTRLHFDHFIRTAIIQLQKNCPLLQKFVLNKLHVQLNAIDDFVVYWRMFDTINSILKRFSDLRYIDLNKLELCWPHIDLKMFLTALRHVRTLYFVTDNLIFANFQCLFDRTSKLRTLHFDYQNTNNSKAILLNLVQYSPKLRVLKLNQVELSHNFMLELPKHCPNLVLLEINPKRFMHHPCKYNFIKLSELNNLSQLCLSNMKIHDKELSFIVTTCVNLAKLHITSSRGLSGNTVYSFKQKAQSNPDVNYELNVDALVDTKYFSFNLIDNFLTSIDNYSFSKINFEPFQKLIVFTPSDEPTVLNVTEWQSDILKFKDFKKLTHYFSKMKYYYIKKTENRQSKWTELVNEDETLIPSHNGKILLEFYESENFIF